MLFDFVANSLVNVAHATAPSLSLRLLFICALLQIVSKLSAHEVSKVLNAAQACCLTRSGTSLALLDTYLKRP